jgi:hypothetical protein
LSSACESWMVFAKSRQRAPPINSNRIFVIITIYMAVDKLYKITLEYNLCYAI